MDDELTGCTVLISGDRNEHIVAEEDEELMSKFFDEGGTLTEDELIEGLTREIKHKQILPVLCSAAVHGIGSSTILDFICRFCPSPMDAEAFVGKKVGSDEYVEIDH